MENKYNVMIEYVGDGSFKFYLSKVGEVEISKGRPIYLYNADVSVITSLRDLKRVLINIKISSNPAGAYRIYDLDKYVDPRIVQLQSRNMQIKTNQVSQEDINSIKSHEGPIVAEGAKQVKAEPEVKKLAAKKPIAKKQTTKKTTNNKKENNKK